MNNYLPDFYIRLELNANATEKDVKRAYSKRLKSIDQATQTDEFLLLRQDYELALAYAKYNAQSDELNQQATENISNNSNETNSSDPSKIMALVALDLAMCGLKFETETRSLSNNVQSENEQLLALVDEFQL